jgi:cellulose 1,4-beta-cellobiosidase
VVKTGLAVVLAIRACPAPVLTLVRASRFVVEQSNIDILPDYFQCVSGAASATVAPTTVSIKPVTTSARPTTTTSGAGTTLVTSRTATGTSPTTSAAAASNAAGNIFAGRQIYANPYYASEVAAAIPALPSSLRAKASAVAKIGTFVWL